MERWWIRDNKKQITESAENTAKYFIKLFKQNDYEITTEPGLFQTDFSDASSNILSSSYQPYNKPNSPVLYSNNF